MTVTYSLNVANTQLNGFAKLLTRWRGSIYKLLYREIFIFCSLYYSLSFIYRYWLNSDQRLVFEKLALYCDAFTKLIPLSFVLGFYVSVVVGRWWNQFEAIPWPDSCLNMITGHIQGVDERSRLIRRTLARYLLILQAFTFQAISPSVRKRFPTEDHLVEAGLMTKEEQLAYEEIPSTHGKWWAASTWFTNLSIRARKEGRIKDDILLGQILDEMSDYRRSCGTLFAYDWISVPLVYTQTVTIATYTYFAATVMGRQYLDPNKGYSGHDVDLYIPIFTILEFFFFMGWLKVAEQLINPFGEDDDDFELNWILDRNLAVSMYIVDQMHDKMPALVKDPYWDEFEPSLPYTKSSYRLRNQPHLGSAMNLDINLEDSEFMPLETIAEYEGVEDFKNIQRIREDSITGSPREVIAEIRYPGDDISQTGSNFLGSRILSLMLGQSSESVSNPNLKNAERDQNFPLSFKRRLRKASTSSSLKPSSSSNQIRESTGDVSAFRHNTGKIDDRRSLIIDLESTQQLETEEKNASSEKSSISLRSTPHLPRPDSAKDRNKSVSPENRNESIVKKDGRKNSITLTNDKNDKSQDNAETPDESSQSTINSLINLI